MKKKHKETYLLFLFRLFLALFSFAFLLLVDVAFCDELYIREVDAKKWEGDVEWIEECNKRDDWGEKKKQNGENEG